MDNLWKSRRGGWTFRLFRRYAERYMSRHFHAVRLARDGYRPDFHMTGPIVVVMNHPSWWDPLMGMVLSGLWPDRARHFAPIEADYLAKYPFFERLGFFGIDSTSLGGARSFLRRGEAALADPDGVLWVTSQGRFADARERPVGLAGGVGHLVDRIGGGFVLPLALEYVFWSERTPEALARFGSPIRVNEAAAASSPAVWTARFERALQATQDVLAVDAMSRDPARFETLVSGRSGVGGIYDGWRRLKAAVHGRRFVAAHGDRTER
jgi:1-acyl-sn-glycerol-3-phosphate acyltransferase